MASFFNVLQFSRSARLVARASLAALLAGASVSAIACEEHDKAAAEQSANANLAKVTANQIFTIGDITIERPWSRATAKGARVAGGYMEIVNNGKVDDVLISGSTDISDVFEVHEMAMKNDVMTMRKLEDGMVIKAGEKAILKPGSYHAMFIGLKRPLIEGETFSADLVFKNAGKVPVTFTVGARGVRQNKKADSSASDAKK